MSIVLIGLAFLLLGAVAGTLSGLLGIGGGLIVVPSLAFLFQWLGMPVDVIMHMAAGTSLAIMIVTTTRSLRSHLKRRVEFWPIYRQLLPGVVVGTVIGAFIAHWLNSQVLSLIFGFFVLIVAIRSWLDHHHTETRRRLPGFWGMNTAGVLIGAKSGLLGVGGGALTIPFLTFCRVDMRKAVVVSAATGLTVALVGTAVFILNGLGVGHLPRYSLGYVYWPAWFPVALGSVLMAPFGAKWSHDLPVVTLQRVFAICLLFIAARLLYSGIVG